jgi:hypothetical protein
MDWFLPDELCIEACARCVALQDDEEDFEAFIQQELGWVLYQSARCILVILSTKGRVPNHPLNTAFMFKRVSCC